MTLLCIKHNTQGTLHA